MTGGDDRGPRRRERKVVTVLFCDLAGFTAQAERLDPEEVEALLRPYHQHVRVELERHGATVEKFIGDAVMALFGAPVAHEDDPERAVRAALAVRDWAKEESLDLRIGITTGEAVVWLDADAAGGEGMASGDVVNTAARLEVAAPVNAILVDETTQRATRRSIEMRPVSPVAAKGKASPISAWEVVAARSRLGADVTQLARTPLVGREPELAVMRQVLSRAIDDATPQLLTLVGIPGVGKSRLVHELRQIVDADERLIRWRQGRCLAYGDGVAFWALAEIVKAEAGVLEGDPERVAASKLRAALGAVMEDAAEAGWVEGHLRPLIGLDPGTVVGADGREQAFAAWRRFLEALGDEQPLVLVFEDVHWAEDGLLDFADELVEWLAGVPVLVVCTARPALLERRPAWGGGKLNASTVGLGPLSDDDTARLIAGALDRPLLPAELQRALLDRAAGNPLFAEQYAQLYLESGSIADDTLPETLQGIVAARLDGLSREDKALLRSGAVMGKIFWTGSVASDREAAARRLHALERSGFVARQRRSSVNGETEWSFAHAILRDVAYGQIPRAERSELHRACAEWIAALGRPEDHAELLAHHWRSARELAVAAGQQATAFDEQLRFALRAAGDRAAATHAPLAAAGYYAEALELWPDDGERPSLEHRYGRVLALMDDPNAGRLLASASDALAALGRVDEAAEARLALVRVEWEHGRRDVSLEHQRRAEELVRGMESAAAARVLSGVGRLAGLGGDWERGLALARRANELAETLKMDDVRAHSLATIGTGMRASGSGTGGAELRKAFDLALTADPREASAIANNLAVDALFELDFRGAAELFEESATIARRTGDRAHERWALAQEVFMNYALGRWDAAMAAADAFIAECEAGSAHYLEGHVRTNRARVLLARGQQAAAVEDHRRAIAHGRAIGDPQAVIPPLAAAALAFELLGMVDEAGAIAREVVDLALRHPGEIALPLVESIVYTTVGRESKQALVEAFAAAGLARLAAVGRACLEREFVRGADLWAEAGTPAWEALTRMFATDELFAAGSVDAAVAQAEAALAFYRRVGASWCIERLNARLQQRETA